MAVYSIYIFRPPQHGFLIARNAEMSFHQMSISAKRDKEKFILATMLAHFRCRYVHFPSFLLNPFKLTVRTPFRPDEFRSL
jgi:hypothetical protein